MDVIDLYVEWFDQVVYFGLFNVFGFSVVLEEFFVVQVGVV